MATPARTEEESLIETIEKLRSSVEALNSTMKSDYPTRREIKDRRRNVALGTFAAIVASYFITVTTVNYCFLDGIPGPDEKNYCDIFPGYDDSFDNNREAVNARKELFNRVGELTERVLQLEEAQRK